MNNGINVIRIASAMIALAYADLTEVGPGPIHPLRAQEARTDRRSAYRWIRSDDDHIMSFVWCCEVTGRSIQTTRKKLLESMGQIVVGRRRREMRKG